MALNYNLLSAKFPGICDFPDFSRVVFTSRPLFNVSLGLFYLNINPDELWNNTVQYMYLLIFYTFFFLSIQGKGKALSHG